MFKRKLQALDFHSPERDFQDETEFRNLICWLEDKKINHYKPEDRTSLRNICAGNWEQVFSKYLADLNCPIIVYDKAEKLKIVDWLLTLAVHLDYGNKAQKMKSVYGYGGGASNNPLEKMDYSSDEFKAGISSLSKLLQIPPHPDPLVTLKAICLLVKEKLSKEALDRLQKKGIVNSLSISLDEVDLGFQTKDLITQEAGKILRLLFLKELRELQDVANEAIVNAQALTANPKTDTKLGKVGV